MSHIAIDLGGTNVRVAVVSDGHILKYQSEPCLSTGSEKEVVHQIITLIESVLDETVDKIGIGVPSVVDYRRGIVYDVLNIPSWKEVHLKDLLEAHFHLDTHVDNDVNCYALGEKRFGGGKPFSDIVGITLGTGVGAGIIVGGNLYRGANTGAGEIGCLPYLDSDYEHYTSSMFFSRQGITGKEMADKAAAEDAAALDLWKQFGRHLGKLLQVILFTYDPEAIIIGGGIASSAPYFEQSILDSMRDGFPYQHEADNIHVLFSQLKDCNLLGASEL